MTRLLLALALLGLIAAGCTANESGSPAPAPASTIVDSSTTTNTSATATASSAAPAITAEPTPDQVPVETTVNRETEPPYAAPAVPVVVLGEQCFSRGEIANTNDGSTAYCSRQTGWGKMIWSLTSGLAANPELQELMLQDGGAELGGICYDDSVAATDAQGRTLYCNPTGDDHYGEGFYWYLVP